MNFILLSAFFGECIDCKNTWYEQYKVMNNIKDDGCLLCGRNWVFKCNTG